MYNVSSLFLQDIYKPSRKLKCKVVVGEVELTEEQVIDFSINYSLGNEGMPGIGGVMSSALTLNLIRDSKTPSYYTNQTIKPYIAIQLSNNGAYEYIPLGVFKPKPDTVEKTDLSIKIECEDILTWIEGYNYDSKLKYPTTAANVLNELKSLYGLNSDITGLPTVNIKVKPNSNPRVAISEIAELYGRNAIINRLGVLTFPTIKANNQTLTVDNYIDFKLTSDNQSKISKLICEKSGNDSEGKEIPDLEYGDTSGATLRFENDSITTKSELQTVFNRCYPISYWAYELKSQGMPHFDVGDKFTLIDKKEVSRELIVLEHLLTFNGGLISEFKANATKTDSSTGSSGSNSISQSIQQAQMDMLNVQHILAGNITADNIAANSISADRIDADTITADLIKGVVIEAINASIGNATIDSAKINAAEIAEAVVKDIKIGTAQIDDLAVTVGKVQNLFVKDLVAAQGKFESAHIGVLTSDNIDADTIKTEHLTAAVISAINASIENATINSAKIGDLSADKITTGSLDADRIKANVISAINASIEKATIDSAKIGDLNASKITAGDISADRMKANAISAINATVGTATINAAKIGNLDASKITSGYISADRIDAGTIDASKIATDTINAIQVGASEITASKIASGDIKVGNANIVDGTLSFAKISNVNITNAHIDKEFVADSYIKNLDAGKITTGTLDASKVTIKNLKADNIVAGSITIDANNLIQNSMLENDTKYWSLGNGWTVDKTTKYVDVNSIKYSMTGQTSDSTHYLIANHNPYGSNTGVKAIAGESFVASAFVNVKKATDGAKPIIGIWFYGVTDTGALTTLSSVRQEIDITKVDQWQRVIVSGKAPANTKYVKLVACVYRNGELNISQPMLSKGTIASIWKPHTDELISDGAIDTDNIADEAISSDKLMTDELFVGENAFINKLKAVEIDAANITTGKISSERLDIKGLVGFDAFDDTMQPVFNVQGNKTYINGGMIATNTIKADKIDLLSGISVKGPDGTNTFAIANNGEVEVNGLLRSGNFDDDKNLGYRIAPDGTAVLNQARIRGDVILPSAGITNYGEILGSDNLFQATDYSMFDNVNDIVNGSTNWYKSAILKVAISQYGHANGKSEDAHIKGQKTLNCIYNIEDGSSQCVLNPRGVGLNGLASTEFIELKPNTAHTFSGWIYQGGTNTGSCGMTVWGYNDDGSNRTALKSTTLTSAWSGSFKYVEFTFTTDSRKYYQPRLYLNAKSGLTEGAVQFLFYNLKLEEGSKATPWCPSTKDNFNPVRIWAGEEYALRNSAPFRVHQDGSVFAANGTFTGTLRGVLDSGDVQVYNNALTIHSPGTEKEVIRLDAGQVTLNTDVVFGANSDKKIIFANSNRQIDFKNMKLNLNTTATTAGANVLYNPSGGWSDSFKLLDPNGGSWVTMGYSGGSNLGTLWITHQGTKGLNSKYGDIAFRAKDINDDVNVTVQGNLMVRKALNSTNNNIEMRATSTGWSFYAT